MNPWRPSAVVWGAALVVGCTGAAEFVDAASPTAQATPTATATASASAALAPISPPNSAVAEKGDAGSP